MENLNDYTTAAWGLVQTWGLRLVYAVIILIVGLWIIKRIDKLVRKNLVKKKIEASLSSFLISLLDITLKILLVITMASMLGIQMTSFIAILGAAGLAVGLALSGTLQNFAGSVIILIFKPFKVGDFIEAQGHMGTVKEIQIFNTILNTPDNKQIIIPNGGLATGSMTNYSVMPTRRVDMKFGIGYSDDIDKARDIIKRLFEEDERILKDPAPFVALHELGDSSVNFVVRPWVEAANYWGVYFDFTEKVKKSFDAEGISIPFPQRDVHLFNEK